MVGKRPWLRVDQICREALDTLLDLCSLADYFSPSESDGPNEIWTGLIPVREVNVPIQILGRH